MTGNNLRRCLSLETRKNLIYIGGPQKEATRGSGRLLASLPRGWWLLADGAGRTAHPSSSSAWSGSRPDAKKAKSFFPVLLQLNVANRQVLASKTKMELLGECRRKAFLLSERARPRDGRHWHCASPILLPSLQTRYLELWHKMTAGGRPVGSVG